MIVRALKIARYDKQETNAGNRRERKDRIQQLQREWQMSRTEAHVDLW
jgi:hypothetical protein